MRNTGKRLNFSSFTLVELMVVITIIIIMAAMLLPALKTAKNAAQSSVCKNNLKQLSLCTSDYADDNKGYIPYQATPSLKNTLFYTAPFKDYVKGPKVNVTSGGVTVTLPQISICPSGKRFDDDAAPNTNANFSYGYNIALSYAGSGYSNLPIYKVKNPGRKFFIADTTTNATGMSLNADFALRHKSLANIIYIDSHVEALRYGAIPINTGENNGFYYDK